jgi:hypothetical protein
VQGRAVSAPNLKKSAAGVEMVAFAQLPHLMPTQIMNDKFPVVHPVNENYGEVDIPVEEELGDPVPLLTRSASGSSRARAKRAGGAGREPRDDAHLVTDTGCPDDLNGPGPWGAGSVGRCLGEHSLRYDTVHSLADEAAAGARHQRGEHAATTVDCIYTHGDYGRLYSSSDYGRSYTSSDYGRSYIPAATTVDRLYPQRLRSIVHTRTATTVDVHISAAITRRGNNPL